MMNFFFRSYPKMGKTTVAQVSSLRNLSSNFLTQARCLSYVNLKLETSVILKILCSGCFLLLLIPSSIVAQADSLQFSSPRSVGVDSILLYEKLDSIVQTGIDSAAFPGVQVLVARKGKIIYYKNAGYHTYLKNRKVRSEDVYDLASITKTIGGTLALMHLYDKGMFDLDKTWKDYFPTFKNSNKADLHFRSILAHQAQLIPYIAFWTTTLRKNGKFKGRTFSKNQSIRFPIYITEDLYLHRKFKKKIYKGIKNSKLSGKQEYRYSGLSFLLYPDLVETKTGQPFDDFLYQTFYIPIDAKRLVFNPLTQFSKEEIVPTEVDLYFRNKIVHGTVHDENAAMLDGISANAGLFGNALSLAKVLQMFLNEGTYGGKRYLKATTVQEFTRCQFCEEGNRRGLGFDKPLIEYDAKAAYVAKSASPSSYGHSGFTGTFYWVDPKEEMIVIFLSNRVHPTRENRKLYTLDIRPSLHQAIYDAIEAY